jgi:hypothetical protein
MKAWVNDVPTDIVAADWQSTTVLRVGVTHEALPFDVLKIQLPFPDPLIDDENGQLCLGFQPLEGTWPAAFGRIFDDWMQPKPNV